MQVQGKDAVLATRYSSPLDCAMKTLESKGVSEFNLFSIPKTQIGDAS
jgi:hypothetical protein